MSSQQRTHQTPATTVPAVDDGTVEQATSGHACGCVSRRQSFVVAGAAVVGTAGLTACGAAEDAAKGVASSAASAASSAAASVAGEAIQAATIPVGGGKVFEDLKVVVTQPTAGDFKAFSATCPHQGCTVASVKDNTITCPCHGSQFDATTGDVKQGPATKGLDPKTVTVGADGLKIT
ncbi:Rieske (2Fe-2S) protein [Oryzobacter telluris]|uniref:Rieske (2Fe-2S) protein n=1 Tax=Oryzobacter telluris TaxID=3149179 RepID=UPI00370D9628